MNNYINTSYEFQARTDKDLRTATVLRIYYQKPDGSSDFWPATLKNGNTLIYTTMADQPGWWTFQPYAEIGGKTWRGEEVKEYFKIPQ
jgi:hypothetical protein